MTKSGRAMAAVMVLVAGVAAIAVGVYLVIRPGDATSGRDSVTTGPSTAPTPREAEPRRARTWGDVVFAALPQLPTTQPLGIPVDPADAAHVILSDPIYVCSRLDLWITRSDAEETDAVLAAAPDEQTHLTRERVLYVHWAPDDRGRWQPQLICRDENGQTQLVTRAARRPVPGKHPYLWHRAMSWNDRIIVPTETGISILTPGKEFAEAHHEFARPESAAAPSEPQVSFDAQGLICWMPWDTGRSGSTGAVRFADGAFSPMGSAEGWPERLVHVVPLLDGSVLQITLGADGKVVPKLSVLKNVTVDVDEQKVSALVDQLSDLDPEKRQAAYLELTRYGPGVWPLLEKLAEDQPVEARTRVRQLLANKIQPTLGGMTLIDGNLTTASRLSDGGVIFFSSAGVSFPREGAEPQIVKPAWISIRPGKAIEILPPQLLKDAAPPRQRIVALANEWVLLDPDIGPQLMLGNHLAPLLRPDEKDYQHVIAVDRRNRFLFRKAPDAVETLVLDTTFADPTPRLPVWLMHIDKGMVGWDQNDWPVIKRGGAWALREEGWQSLNGSKNKLYSDKLPDGASTAPALPSGERPLLVDAEGNRYYDGAMMLHVVSAANKHLVWPLPPSARGRRDGKLLRTQDGRLFLFNLPGRIVRICPTPDGPAPFKLEAIFAHRVPVSDDLRRVWLDRAGRIIMAYEGTRLAIMFPQGHLPPAMSLLISTTELE